MPLSLYKLCYKSSKFKELYIEQQNYLSQSPSIALRWPYPSPLWNTMEETVRTILSLIAQFLSQACVHIKLCSKLFSCLCPTERNGHVVPSNVNSLSDWPDDNIEAAKRNCVLMRDCLWITACVGFLLPRVLRRNEACCYKFDIFFCSLCKHTTCQSSRRTWIREFTFCNTLLSILIKTWGCSTAVWLRYQIGKYKWLEGWNHARWADP